MKTSKTIIACAVAAASAAAAFAQSAAVNPFTYLGRVTDATHAAFDTNRVAKLSAFDSNGRLLARTETFFRPESRRNYSLRIPLADGEADGYATPGAILSISVDDGKKTWTGVVVDEGRASGTVVGEPGGVREVDIVLGEDANGDGMDDSLFKRLKAEWEDSAFWDPDAGFDPRADHDGDGASTIDEALAGTDPFNARSVLRITAFALADGAAADAGYSLSFPTVPGRAYALQTTGSLTGKWENVSFFLAPGDGIPVNILSRPSLPPSAPATVYLMPAKDRDAAFFRVRSE